jgi:hypothetical protein
VAEHQSSDEAALNRRYTRSVLTAKLRGIELKGLIDQAIDASADEAQLRAILAQPPFGFDDLETEAVLNLQVRNRTSWKAAELRRVLAELDEVE